jgi:hypothetical protein
MGHFVSGSTLTTVGEDNVREDDGGDSLLSWRGDNDDDEELEGDVDVM